MSHEDDDLSFFRMLGPEIGPAGCGKPGCTRRSVQFSAMCRSHHFEMIRQRPCSFDETHYIETRSLAELNLLQRRRSARMQRATRQTQEAAATAEPPIEISTLVDKLLEYGFPEGHLESRALLRSSRAPRANWARSESISPEVFGPREALARELLSSDWRRIEAGARGLGLSGDASARRPIEGAIGSDFDRSVAEVHQALMWASNELRRKQQQTGSASVDRNNIWQQINSVPERFPDTAEGHRQREDAIALCRAIVTELPGFQVRLPGYDYPPDDAKARAWSCLATNFSFLIAGGAYRACAEAKHCYEEAAKLQPENPYWTECIKNVS